MNTKEIDKEIIPNIDFKVKINKSYDFNESLIGSEITPFFLLLMKWTIFLFIILFEGLFLYQRIYEFS